MYRFVGDPQTVNNSKLCEGVDGIPNSKGLRGSGFYSRTTRNRQGKPFGKQRSPLSARRLILDFISVLQQHREVSDIPTAMKFLL